MEENEEKKLNAEELKNEASNTVNQVKETIKTVNIKKDSVATKGFIGEMFKKPLETIEEIAKSSDGKFLKYAIIIIAIWAIAELVKEAFSINMYWGYSYFGSSVVSILKSAIEPILGILVMSIIVYVLNSKAKKSLTTIISTITSASIPIVIASVVGILTIFSSSISMITVPFGQICNAVSIVLMYFALKSLFTTEKNSDFIKKFVTIEIIYYMAYIILALFKLYI